MEQKKTFSFDCSDYEDTDAREKINENLAEYSSKSAVFSIKFSMEEIEQLVVEI